MPYKHLHWHFPALISKKELDVRVHVFSTVLTFSICFQWVSMMRTIVAKLEEACMYIQLSIDSLVQLEPI